MESTKRFYIKVISILRGIFLNLTRLKIDNSELHFDKAQIAIGITDLRGVVENPDFKIGNKKIETTVGVVNFFL
jgi:hypothetical protein